MILMIQRRKMMNRSNQESRKNPKRNLNKNNPNKKVNKTKIES